MKLAEIRSVAKAVAPAIREYADAAQKPLVDRMDSVVSRLDALAARLDELSTSEADKVPNGRRRKAAGGFDGKAFAEEVVDAVKSYVAKATDAVNARIDAIEQRVDATAAMPGTNDIEAEVARQVEAALADRPQHQSVTIEDLHPIIECEVAAAVERLKRQESAARNWPTQRADGWPYNLPTIDVDAVPTHLELQVSEAVALLPKPAN